MYRTTVYYPILIWDDEEVSVADRVIWFKREMKLPLLPVGMRLWVGGELVEDIVLSIWNAPEHEQTLVLTPGRCEGGWCGLATWVGRETGLQETEDQSGQIGFMDCAALHEVDDVLCALTASRISLS